MDSAPSRYGEDRAVWNRATHRFPLFGIARGTTESDLRERTGKNPSLGRSDVESGRVAILFAVGMGVVVDSER